MKCEGFQVPIGDVDGIPPYFYLSTTLFDDLLDEAFGFVFEFKDGVADGGEGAHWLGFVEVAGEADFVADLDGVGLVPGVGGVREDLALQEGLNGRRTRSTEPARCRAGQSRVRTRLRRWCR